jgi:tetratricopeptide (TPR) repeat protein
MGLLFRMSVKRTRLVGQSALQAFRADIPADGLNPTREDDAAVLVATLLRHSLAAQDAAVTEQLTDEALKVARASLGADALAEGATYDDHPATSRADVIRLLSQRTDRMGRLRVAEHMLESAAELESDPVECGRILSDRSRVSRKLGRLDLSQEQNHELLRDARRLRSPELAAKAHAGLAAIAETRGNYAEFRNQLNFVIRFSKSARLTNLLASGYSGVATSEALAGRYGNAVTHFWKAYRLVDGRGHIGAALLGNLAQTLLISGRPAEARKVATVLLQNAPPSLSKLPSLGTFAIASAQLRDLEAVRWASAEVRVVGRGRTDPRDLAEALMECSAALEFIGERTEGATMKRRAEALALQYGLHALTFKEAMQSVQTLSAPLHFTSTASRVAAEIRDLEVPRLPASAAALPL